MTGSLGFNIIAEEVIIVTRELLKNISSLDSMEV